MAEIGSEFWEAADTGKKKYLISGRAALEYIIRDILEEHSVDSVLMPSYCCYTMLEPFVRHGIKIRFYDIFYDEEKGLCAKLPEEDYTEVSKENHDNEIFYYMTFFGFSQLSGLDVKQIRDIYGLIIVDRTHSWLSDSTFQVEIDADYTYISFRKWTGFYGIAEAIKQHAPFVLELGTVGSEYSEHRKEAMMMKNDYIKWQRTIEVDEHLSHATEIAEAEGQKKNYLNKYDEAEDFLDEHYVGNKPTTECVYQLLLADWNFVKGQRRTNAVVLLQGLRDIPEIKLMYGEQSEMDVPLFVPILVKDDRDGLRRHLINKQIYCPVHWPLSKYHQNISNQGKEIYNREISLVCNQRYTEEDMNRIVDAIKDFFDKKSVACEQVTNIRDYVCN